MSKIARNEVKSWVLGQGRCFRLTLEYQRVPASERARLSILRRAFFNDGALTPALMSREERQAGK